MREHKDLTEQEQQEAINIQASKMLSLIVDGYIRFDDAKNGDNLQAAIDAAIHTANNMLTPWFAGEYIWDAVYQCDGQDVPVGDMIMDIAESEARQAFYPSADEIVIRLD